ncbi:hypothetical protein FRC17_010495 [Serendipita sp. 399]|nr:hypothetical protein FRC17_010495 [Serendipita sp. 399]
MNFEDIQEATGYEQGLAAEIARRETQALLDELERKKRARAIAVPTDDGRVKKRLRELGEPITLFGERAADRRARLIHLLSQKGDDVPEAMEVDESEDEEEEEEFYTPGSLDLLEARRKIAEYSLPRSEERFEMELRLNPPFLQGSSTYFQTAPGGKNSADENHRDEKDTIPRAQGWFSLATIVLARNNSNADDAEYRLRGGRRTRHLTCHSDKVGGVAWHPKATLSLSPSAANLVTGAAEGSVHLWSLDSEVPLSVLLGHKARVARVCFHPSGDYVVSASFDGTWRLWDVNTSTELLLQSGHSKEVFAVACQNDGSLVASGGLDAFGRIWDLRTGRTAMVLNGHVQPIYAIDFSPNGYQVATGGGDDTLRLWDIRALKSVTTIPAHRSNVSDVRFFHSSSPLCSLEATDDGESMLTEEQVSERYRSGLYLVSSGYDGLVKIWSADDWQLVKSLTTDAEKVMSVDLSSDGKYLASGSFSRSYQLFTTEGYSG